MRRYQLPFLIVTIAISCAFLISCSTTKKMTQSVFRDSGPKKKIALLGIQNRTEFGLDEYVGHLESLLLSRLERSGGLKVFSPADVRAAGIVVGEGRAIDMMDRILPWAKQQGLNAVVKGNISELELVHRLYGVYGFRHEKPTLQMVVRLELVDVETRTVLYEGNKRAQLKLDLPEGGSVNDFLKKSNTLPNTFLDSLLLDMGGEILDVMASQPWRSYIVAEAGDSVTVSAGKDAGLKAGDTLAVWSEGKDIVNYAGQKFRIPGEPIGTIRCEEINEATSRAVIVKGGNIHSGLPVRTLK